MNRLLFFFSPHTLRRPLTTSSSRWWSVMARPKRASKSMRMSSESSIVSFFCRPPTRLLIRRSQILIELGQSGRISCSKALSAVEKVEKVKRFDGKKIKIK